MNADLKANYEWMLKCTEDDSLEELHEMIHAERKIRSERKRLGDALANIIEEAKKIGIVVVDRETGRIVTDKIYLV